MGVSATAEMNFDDLAPVEVPVTINKTAYVLKEATEDAVRQYRNAQLRETKMVDGKATGIGNMADTTSFLLSLCLYDTVPGSCKPVPLAVIRSWPAKVVSALVERLKLISNLDQPDSTDEDKAEAALKNG